MSHHVCNLIAAQTIFMTSQGISHLSQKLHGSNSSIHKALKTLWLEEKAREPDEWLEPIRSGWYHLRGRMRVFPCLLLSFSLIFLFSRIPSVHSRGMVIISFLSIIQMPSYLFLFFSLYFIWYNNNNTVFLWSILALFLIIFFLFSFFFLKNQLGHWKPGVK